jgi:hypothetical protein
MNVAAPFYAIAACQQTANNLFVIDGAKALRAQEGLEMLGMEKPLVASAAAFYADLGIPFDVHSSTAYGGD